MRYEGLKDILDLAVRLQGAHGGLTLDDIEAEFSISRRTAERRRDAVDAAFGPLEPVDRDDDGKRHWRLRSDALRRLVSVSAEELAELGAAAAALDRAGFGERAAMLRDLAVKLQATLRAESQARVESDLEMLVQAEAWRCAPVRGSAWTGACSPSCAKPSRDLPGGRVPLLRPIDEAAEPAAGSAPRPALREPRAPGGVDRVGRGAAAVASREHERSPDHR